MIFRETKITGRGTDEIFGTCRGNYSFQDNLLLESTLRFLALKRSRGDISQITPLLVDHGEYSGADLSSKIRSLGNKYTFYIYDACYGYDDITPYIEVEGYESTDTWRVPVSTILTSKTGITTKIYVNSTNRRVIILINTKGKVDKVEKWIEVLSSLVFVLVPWLYGDNYDGHDETEQALFKAIARNDALTFTQIIDDYCKNIDFSEVVAREDLKNWTSIQRNTLIDQTEEVIQHIRTEIEHMQAQIRRQMVELSSQQETLIALQSSEASHSENEFFDFLKSRGLHYLCKTTGWNDNPAILYSVVEYLENYDRDEFLRIFNTAHSYMNLNRDRIRAARLMYAVFVDEKARFRTEAVFRLTTLSVLEPVTIQPEVASERAIPHPHLTRFRCLGGNREYIEKFLMEGDWDMAIDQTIQATKNINFGDSVVVSKMMDAMFNELRECRFIVLPDGNEMNPSEFECYLAEEEQGDNNNG